MASEKGDAFSDLFKGFKEAHPELKAQDVQKKTTLFWNSIKRREDYKEVLKAKMVELKKVANRKKSGLMAFWAKVPQKDVSSKSDPQKDVTSKSDKESESQPNKSTSNNASPDAASSKTKATSPAASKAQTEIKEQISILQGDINALLKRQSANFLTSEDEKTLKLKKKELEGKEKKLKALQLSQVRQINFRQKRKMEMSKLFETNPQLKSEFPSLREKKGRPRLEEDQSDLLNTIAKIAIHGSAAEDKRRSDMMRSIKTLGELKEELGKLGYSISRSGLYLRLMPKRSNTSEGKRHVVTVPVRLIRASNDKHVSHIDGKFCTATIKGLEEIAAVLGPQQVFFLSQDDKARVPIGLSAANKQSPLLMHVEYKVTLPDHDWVVAPQHKLIPSVYAGIVIEENCFDCKTAVSYSGPTFIAIRSGKHSSSTAFSHVKDLKTVLELPEFQELVRVAGGGQTKPVFMFTVDGGPDENPRYEKVIVTGIHHFIENNLDALFIATNAPGRSAFNRVERRMAPLSKELAGVILPYDSFGAHLDNQGRTTDQELELKNFQKAGETLAEIWSDLIIDKHPVTAKFVRPDESEVHGYEMCQKDMTWRRVHVRESQYFTQIVKCFDERCCSSPRSDYFKIMPQRFLPPPLPLLQSANGLTCPDFPMKEHQLKPSFTSVFLTQSMDQQALLPKSAKLFKEVPYDLYCPSVQGILHKRICKQCGLYHSSITRLVSHNKVCHPTELAADVTVRQRPLRIAARRQRELLVKLIENGDLEWADEGDIDDGLLQVPNPNVPTTVHIASVEDYLASPWENE